MARFKKLVERKILFEVDSLSYDLQEWYDHWNQKLFGSELNPVRLRYSDMKQLGKTKAYTRKSRGRVTDVESIEWLAISKMYEMPEEVFHATLIHEMIHVYMLQNHEDFTWEGGYHGSEFKRLADEKSNQSGHDVAVYHDLYEDELQVRGEGKDTVVTVVYERGEPQAWGLRPSAWTPENKSVVYDFVERYRDWEIIRTTSPAVKQITRSRKVPRRLKFTPLSDSTIQSFRQSGKVIDRS